MSYKQKKTFLIILVFVVLGGAIVFKPWNIATSTRLFLLNSISYLQRGISAPAHWLKNWAGSYVSLHDVRSENEGLKKEVSDLQERLLQYHEAYLENKEFRKLLEIKVKAHGLIVFANVVSRNIAPWIDDITVDMGTKNGVAPGMLVRSDRGIIGKVEESYPDFSKVILITHKALAVSALVQRTRVNGVLKGNGLGKCILMYVGKEADVTVGDEVITSGADQIFPKGIKIGKIISIQSAHPSDFFKEITVEPAVDLKNLEYVAIQLTNK